MSSTDDRIVRMQFDNASFKKGAADTQKSLADVNAAMAAAGKSTGLTDMSSAMGRVQVSASNMSVVVGAALATITAKAVDAGLNMVKALTFDPIKQGFLEYEELLTKQNVIMNATGKSAGEVKGYLNELNKYSDETIYSFSNMTASIAKFVNAGISLPQSVESIKGIANAAAFAGASTEEANRAMYAFSQSMSTGYLMLNDWMQIENANMATMGFKEELLKAGVAAGTLTKNGKEYITTSGAVVTATKGWREGMQEQWATTEVMNSALSKYTDLSTKLGRQATEAATEVRTFTAFMDTLKESLGSGWANIFTSLFGNLEQATAMWTGLADATGKVVGGFFDWASTTLKVWRNMGGFEKTLQGFKNLLSPIGALFDVIGTAMRAAFPSGGRGSGKALYALSSGFEAITRPLQLLADLIRGATGPVTVFFQVIRIGIAAIKEAAGFIADFVAKAAGLVDLPAPSGGGFLGFIKDIARAIGDAIGKISDLLAKGRSLGEAFSSVSIGLPDMPSMPSLPDMPSMPSLPSLSGIFGGDDGGASSTISSLAGGVDSLKESVSGLNAESENTEDGMLFNPDAKLDTSRMDDFSTAVDESVEQARTWKDRLQSLGSSIGDALGNMVDQFGAFIKGFSIDDLVKAFNMAAFTTLVITVVRFVKMLQNGMEGFARIPNVIPDLLGSVGGALDSFGTAAKAKLITAYAIAIGILALSLFALSFVPAKKLASGLAGIGALLAMMTVSIKILTKAVDDMEGDKLGFKMAAIVVALLALASAMLILSVALLIMEMVSWNSIAKGLSVMVVMLTAVSLMGERMNDAAGKNLLGAAAAIMAISLAMVVLSGALILMDKVKWESLAKAGLVLGALAAVIFVLGRLPGWSMAALAVAMIALSTSMVALTGALLMMEDVKWESIGKLAVVLGTLAIALGLMMMVGGPVAVSGMIGLGIGMMAIAQAGIILNNVDWSSIGKIAVILLAMVLAFAALGLVAAVAAAPIALLGVAILALGAGVALFGLGVGLFVAAMAAAIALGAAGAAAFAAFATAAAVAIGVFVQTLALQAPVIKDALLAMLQEMIDGIVEAVPMIIKGIRDLISAVVKELSGGDNQRQFADTGQSWISRLADGIQKNLPEIIRRGADIVIAFIRGLASRAAELARAAVNLVVEVIQGIASRAGELVRAGVDLVVELARGLGDGLPRMLNAGVDLIIDFLNGLATTIRTRSGAVGGALMNVVGAMFTVGVDLVQGLINGLGSMIGDAVAAIGNLVGDMISEATSRLRIFSPSKVFHNIGKFLVEGLTQGIQRNAASAISAVASMVGGQIAMADGLISKFIQRMDQQAIAARAKADGLAAAADTAAKLANKTKSKKDDKAAENLGKQASKADKAASQAENKVSAEEARRARAKEFRQSDLFGKAQMKSEDAQKALEAVKNSERKAAAALIEADALEKQAKAEGVTKKQRKELLKDAQALRDQAKEDAKRANQQRGNAKKAASEALKYQRQAGAEAAAAFESQFVDEATSAAKEAAFEQLSDVEKAAQRTQEAIALEKAAEEDLARAKKLAFKDLTGANALAQIALAQAEAARQARAEAAGYLENGGGPGQVLQLDPTALALAAFNQYQDLYNSSNEAAASAPSTVEFNQYNTSPESLNDAEVYRQTNNLLTYAAGSISPGI